jgi:hypothetical protein
MAQLFPKWTNRVPAIATTVGVFGLCAVIGVVWYWFSPKHTQVGYSPEQPVDFSHKLHAGQLGMSCLSCHSMAERTAAAGVPTTQTCMQCHTTVRKDSFKLAPVMESFSKDIPVPWLRVHKEPDYVYFDHSIHIAVGVGCISCHGAVHQMARIRQEQPLSMSFCLNCHRDPAPHLRPLDQVDNMDFVPTAAWLAEAKIRAKSLHPPTASCSGCHR